MPIRNLNVIIAAAVVSLLCYHTAPGNHYARKVAATLQLIHDNYVEPVETQTLYEHAMEGMVGGLDPYSDFIPPAAFQKMEETLDQQFGGIGIMVELGQDTKRLTVLSPLINTPAYEAGLRAGDVILEIDGKSTEGVTLDESVLLMRGEPGSTVKLRIRHAGEDQELELSVERAIIPVESVLGDTREADGRWNFTLEQDPRIRYVRLINFGKNSAEELRATLQLDPKEKPYQALILDLRGNAGGLLTAAVEICDLFISSGPIVSTRGRGGVIRDAYYASQQVAVPEELPLVVLVDHFSASASEIVAACLQDHARAVVVGERSWGKGTVQNIIELEAGRHPSALKLTTAKYWRPSGRNIHRDEGAKDEDDWGVRPNYDVPLSDEQREQVALRRRERDIFRAQPPESSGAGEQAQPGAASDERPRLDPTAVGSEDPQLRKAVEFLQNKLKLREARLRAA